MRDTSDLPDDLDALKAMIAASSAVIADRDAVIERKEDRIQRLEKLLADLPRERCLAQGQRRSILISSSWRWKTSKRRLPRSMQRMRRLIRPSRAQPNPGMPIAVPYPSICRGSKK